jgi:hypothetical protein
MQLDALDSPAAARAALTRAAVAVWGEARAAALQAQLDATAQALWELAQEPLDLEGPEPDFIYPPEPHR